MIGSGFFGTGNRYIINTFIVQEMAPSSCPFERGLVTMANTKGVKPASTWAATSLAYQAWEAAIRNEAMVGIYSKVDNDIDNFYPGKEDVLGNWNCAKGDVYTIIQPDEWTKPALKAFIDRQTFIPGPTDMTGVWLPSSSVYRAFMAWGQYISRSTNLTSYRAMLATPADREATEVPVNVTNIECTLQTFNSWKPMMWTEDAYEDWTDTMFGFVMELSDAEEYAAQFTKVLNAMSMVSGSNNGHFVDAETAAEKGAGTTYGCLEPSTRIYGSVIIITVILIALVLVMLVIDLYDVVRNKFDKRHREVEKMPFEMLDWQVALVEKMTGDEIKKPRALARYEYFIDESGRSCCRKVQKKGAVYEAVENPGNTSSGSEPSLAKNGIIVSSREK